MSQVKALNEVNEDLTRRVAHLARLELSDQEVRTFTPQLAQIVGYIDLLSEANVQNLDGSEIEPFTHAADLSPGWRPDQIVTPLVDDQGKPRVLASAPEVVEDGFKVPPIL